MQKQYNPEPETSWSDMTDANWYTINSRWSRGIDWCVYKIGRKWYIGEEFPNSWPVFLTKHAAFDALTTMVLAESRHRLGVRMLADGYQWNGERWVREE